MARTVTNTKHTKLSAAKAKNAKALDAQSLTLNQSAAEQHSSNDFTSISQPKKNFRSKVNNSQRKDEQESGQTLASAKSAIKFENIDNPYDVSSLKTGLFQTESSISSSSSADANSNNNGWQKYVWYGAAGIGVVGAGVLIANSRDGSGGGSSPSVPVPVVADINNFQEFCASGLFENPTISNITLNGDSYEYILDNGFERPESYAGFNFGALDYASLAGFNVGPSGLEINVNTEEASVYAQVIADAEDGESEVIWMENLSIASGTDNTHYANVEFEVYAEATYGSADAEIGICDLSVSIDAEHGSVLGNVVAYATSEAEANVFINDLDFEVKASDAEGETGVSLSIYATATSEAVANVTLGNINIDVTASSAFAVAAISALNAYATQSSSANVTIGELGIHTSVEDGENLALSLISGVVADASDYSEATVTLGNAHISSESNDSDALVVAALGEDSNPYNYSTATVGAFASDYASASVNFEGNIDIEATANDQYSEVIASMNLSNGSYVEDIEQSGIVASAMSHYANAEVIVAGNINITATAADKFSEANASFANSENWLSGGYGNIDFYQSGIMAKVGEDSFSNAVYNSEARIEIGDINITALANRDGGDARALFMVGEDANHLSAYITANNNDGAENLPEYRLENTSASVDLGTISLSASAQDTAYAGMIFSDQIYGYDADSAILSITASVYAYGVGDNNSNFVDIDAISISASVAGEDGADARAFLTTGANAQGVEIASTLAIDGENNSSSVDIGSISIEAESSNRYSTAKAFGSGDVSISGQDDFNGFFDANIEMSATNYGWENATSSLEIGDIDISATTSGRSSYAEAFVVGQIESNTSIESDFDISSWTPQGSEGISTTQIGNVSITATTLGKNSDATAFISGALDAEVYINSSAYNEIGFYGEDDGDLDVTAHFTIEAGARSNGTAELHVESISVLADASAVNSKASDATAFLVGNIETDSYVSLTDINTTNGTANSAAYATSSAYVILDNYARAEFEIFAEAYNDADTNLEVGNISVVANANTADLENKDATAYMAGNVHARAEAYASAEAYATANGNIAVNAYADASAYAGAFASAYASVRFEVDAEEDSRGNLSIGNINIEAVSGIQGDALAYMAGFANSYAYADANEIATATGANGGNGFETNDTPGYEYSYANSTVNVEIVAETSDYAQASLDIDSITISAIGGTGEGHAVAFMAGYGEDASVNMTAYASDYSESSVDIGDITISASKLSGTGDVNAFMVGQSINLGNGEDGMAILDINSTQYEYGTALLEIDSIDISASADDGLATAALAYNGYSPEGDAYGFNFSVVDIAANATGYQGDASVTIDSIKVSATSIEGSAYASLATGNAVAFADLNSFADRNDESPVSGPLQAELNILNGIEISAEADNNAFAAISMAGLASFANISAYGEDGGHATTSIENITISAISHNGSAYAGTNIAYASTSDGYIRAYSDGFYDDNTSAHLDILGGITVTADALDDAIAMIDNINTTAYSGGESVVEIGNISLTATGEGSTSAYISEVGARAENSAAAETNISNISINVGGIDADNAHAYLYIQAEARDDSNATVTIDDILMTAESDSTGGHAQVHLDINTDTYDNLGDENSSALVDIGNINLSVTGGDGDETYVNLSIYADVSDEGASSSIQVGDITLTSLVSTMDDGEDTIWLDIDASDTNYASVNVGDISINLLGNVGSSAYVNVGSYDIDYDQIDIGNLAVNIENANSQADIYIDGVAADYNRSLTINGAGDVELYLDTDRNFGDQMAFNKIYLTNVSYNYQTLVSDGDIEVDDDSIIEENEDISVNVVANHTGSLYFQFGDYNLQDTSLSLTGNLTFEPTNLGGQQDLIPHTTIYGYDTSGSSTISFNGTFANSEYFYDISNESPETTANDLWQSIADQIDSSFNGGGWYSDVYIYNTVDEQQAGDINGDGYLSDSLGVLTYSEFGNDFAGVSAIVFLNDLNGTINADNISGIFA